jgi:hypothetical protein
MSGRYNASELNAQSQPGTTGAVNPNDAEHAPTRGNLTSPSGTSESSATGAASTDDAEHAPTAGGTDANRQPVEVYHRQTSIYVVPNDPNQDATVAHTQQSWSAPGGTEPSAQSTGAQSSAASPSQSRTRALDQGNVAPGQAGIGARDYNSGGSMSESGTSTSGAAPGTGSATDNSPSSTSTQSQSTDQRFDALIHNDVLSPDSVIGPAGGLREGNDLGNASGVSPGGDRMHSGSSSSMGSSSGMSRSSTSTGNSGNM